MHCGICLSEVKAIIVKGIRRGNKLRKSFDFDKFVIFWTEHSILSCTRSRTDILFIVYSSNQRYIHRIVCVRPSVRSVIVIFELFKMEDFDFTDFVVVDMKDNVDYCYKTVETTRRKSINISSFSICQQSLNPSCCCALLILN